MKYGWRVPHNTQSFIVREVCQAIIDEYMAKVMTCPTTPEDGVPYLTSSSRSGTSPIMWCTRWEAHCLQVSSKEWSQYFNYKGFYSVVLMGLVDADYKFIRADLSGKGSSSDAQIYNNSEIKEFAVDATIGFPAPDAVPNDYQDVTLLLHRQRCLRPPKDHDEAIQPPGSGQ